MGPVRILVLIVAAVAAIGLAFVVRGAPPAMVELSGLYGIDALLGFAPAVAVPHSVRA